MLIHQCILMCCLQMVQGTVQTNLEHGQRLWTLVASLSSNVRQIRQKGTVQARIFFWMLVVRLLVLNRWHPNISMHILYTVLYTFTLYFMFGVYAVLYVAPIRLFRVCISNQSSVQISVNWRGIRRERFVKWNHHLKWEMLAFLCF